MAWLPALLVAVLAGALGVVAGGLVMYACVLWYRISSFEGKSGYAIVTVAFLAGVASFVLGLVLARLIPAQGLPGFLKGLAVACAAVLAIAGIAAAVARALADVPPRIGGQELVLELEVRLPEGAALAPDFDLHAVVRGVARRSRRGAFRLADARAEGGRTIVPGEVHVFTGRGRRAVSLQLEGRPPSGFLVPLPARPKRKQEAWSDWGPRPVPPRPPWPDTEPSYRFRVRRMDA
jgi:hypothetical protein